MIYGRAALCRRCFGKSQLNGQSASWALPSMEEGREIYWKYILDLLERMNSKKQPSSTWGEKIKKENSVSDAQYLTGIY